MKKFLLAFACVAASYSCTDEQQAVTVTITNPLNMERSGEMVEVSAEEVFRKLNLPDTAQLVVYDDKAQEVPYQLTYDDKLIFPASVAAQATVGYTIQEGEPMLVNTVVYGRQYPERADDVAWENDRAAYRAYGPALQRSGEKAYGYDVFTKNTEELVVEDRYRMELDSASWAAIHALQQAGKKAEADSLRQTISYHVDHGNGMDCYAVGPTLGGGTSALMPDGKLIYPYCYNECEVLDNGPLRFTVKLVYNPLVIKNDSNVVETRIIQLDKGSQLNKTTVNYAYLTVETPLATGLVIHAAHPKEYVCNAEKGYIAYADPTTEPNADNGTVYVGAVFPYPVTEAKAELFDAPVGDALGHVLAISPYAPDDDYVYYWGSGWSKYGFAAPEDWTNYLENFAAKVRNPLQVTIE